MDKNLKSTENTKIPLQMQVTEAASLETWIMQTAPQCQALLILKLAGSMSAQTDRRAGPSTSSLLNSSPWKYLLQNKDNFMDSTGHDEVAGES